MKLIYHIYSLCNPGGMERVVLNKGQQPKIVAI